MEDLGLVEDILDSDSDSGSDSEFDADDSENGQQLLEDDDPIPNFHFNWKKETASTKFTPPPAIYSANNDTFNSPSPPIDTTTSPFDILKSYVTAHIIGEVIEETNRYANQIKSKNPKALVNWKNVSINEMWSFIALQLLTGLIKKTNYKDYWSTDKLLETPIFPNTMSRTRFENILRSFHFTDNNHRTSRINSRVWKLVIFLPELIRNFEHSINVGEYLCVDESLLLFKERLSFKQYMPMKRSRFGIKYFVLVDCETKFLLKLEVYLGKSSNFDTAFTKEFGLGGSTVISLLNGYYRENHKVVLDNWFNSQKLVEYLATMKTYSLGTVKKNRKGLPKQFSGKLTKGEVDTYSTENCLLERWQDRREVVMLNSFIEHRMEDSLSANTRNHRLKPKLVLVYNKMMGGVDHIDQQLAPYESLIKSIKWYKKLAFHLIDLAIYNSFVVYKYHNPSKTITYMEFLKELIRNILKTHKIERRKPGRPNKYQQIDTTSGKHWPQKMLKENLKPKYSDCSFCKKNGKRKATSFSCELCRKHMCISGSNSCLKKVSPGQD